MDHVYRAGKHAFGIHESADLSHNCALTGGRYNPTGATPKKSGDPDSKDKKAGDLGNILSDVYGSAFYMRWEKDLSAAAIIGRSVVVMAG